MKDRSLQLLLPLFNLSTKGKRLMNGLFDNRNMAIVYHECIWAFSIFSLFLLVSFRVLFHERNQVGDKIRIYSLAELPEEESRLMEAAIKATGQSYAPYSKFHVGAAALLEDGTIITGSNQENAAYPSGLCAERVALFMPAINIRICLLSLLPLQPPRMAGRSRAFPLAVHAARFCWRRNNAMASR